jgi:26S proteasome non-ATPase regulatory subunit 9
MRHLEKGIHDHFSNLQRTQGVPSSISNTNGSTGAQTNSVGNYLSDAAMLGPPFAKVNSVAVASPADQAGLKLGDRIRSFGSVNWINHERLSKVAELVQQNEGVSLLFYPLLSFLRWRVVCRSREGYRLATG